MKVGDLVQWYTEYADCISVDIGLVSEIKLHPDGNQAFIVWQTGDGNGWFCPSHPSIGVISESR